MAKLEKKPKTRCKCTGIFSGSEGITIILFKICSKLSVMNIYYFIQLEKGKQILFRNLDRYTSAFASSFWFFFQFGHAAELYRSLVPWPEFEPGDPTVKALNPNEWTTGRFPASSFLWINIVEQAHNLIVYSFPYLAYLYIKNILLSSLLLSESTLLLVS